MNDDYKENIIYPVPLDPEIVRVDLPLLLFGVVMGTIFSLISRYPPLIIVLILISSLFTVNFVIHYMRSPIELKIGLEGLDLKKRNGKSKFLPWHEINWFEFRDDPTYMMGFCYMWTSPNGPPFTISRAAAEEAILYYQKRNGKKPLIVIKPSKNAIWKK